MIEKTSAYKTSDGQTHACLATAQAHALEQLGLANGAEILSQRDAVIAILKLKPRKAKAGKPKKPAVKGGTP